MAPQATIERSLHAPGAGADVLPVAKRGRLRVLHVVSQLARGGTEYGVLKLITGLEDELFDHRICAIRGVDPYFESIPQLKDKFEVAGRPVSGFQFPLSRLMQIMKSYKPHIVHTRNWGGIEAILAARLARVPVAIHSEHGYELDILAGLPYRRRLLRRVLYAMADAVFTVSRDLRSYHAPQAWFSPRKIRVIYNGVDTRLFSPRTEVRSQMRKSLSIPTNSFVVGTVGRLVPIKDQGMLLCTGKILIRQGIDLRVLLVGSGPELASLQEYARASAELGGRVLFLGAADNVPELLNAMDVFVLPSICEGMSNTLLEAMACRLPVVATRVGGNPELVEEDRTGWLFAPGDSVGLARQLRRLASDTQLRCRLGAGARRRAVQHFNLEEMLKAYRNLYFGLVRRRGVLARS